MGTSNLYNPTAVADPQSVAPASYLAFVNKDRGVFVSDFITFNDRWQALVGVRRSSVDFFSVFSAQPYRETVVTPSLALIFKPRPDTSVYASYVEGLEQGGSAPLSAANANALFGRTINAHWTAGVKIAGGFSEVLFDADGEVVAAEVAEGLAFVGGEVVDAADQDQVVARIDKLGVGRGPAATNLDAITSNLLPKASSSPGTECGNPAPVISSPVHPGSLSAGRATGASALGTGMIWAFRINDRQ